MKHLWLSISKEDTTEDLLPNVRHNFNARRTFKKAIDLVRLSYQLRHKHMPVRVITKEDIKEAENEVKPVSEGIDQVLNIK